MLFNSLEFIPFFLIVFFIYWVILRRVRHQNILLLIASYFFYGWWDWRFLSLIFASSLIDYTLALRIQATEKQLSRKAYLVISCLFNLGMLGVFKYYNFFTDNIIVLLDSFGLDISFKSLNIILPIGISFYTFQTLSYTIDVYRRKMKATSDLVNFMTFVSFFPQLVAGPIERAIDLLPQFSVKRKITYKQSIQASRQILWGFFKKVVVADNCATYVDILFNSPQHYPGVVLVLGAILFAFQIYCDFSGYSDIAIGVARFFGFRLKQNFAFPYFSRDIAEFWRRWHISLSTWFRDYLYIPLGGSRTTTKKAIRNIFVIFLVSGFWHGANWTFIIWGLLNALYFLPQFLGKTNRRFTGDIAANSILPSIKEQTQIFYTFSLTVFAWIFFRAESLSAAIAYVRRIFSIDYYPGSLKYIFDSNLTFTVAAILILICVEWYNRSFEHGLYRLTNHKIFNYSVYVILLFLIAENFFGNRSFIYFQF